MVFLVGLLLAEFAHLPRFALSGLGIVTTGAVACLTLRLAAEIATSGSESDQAGSRSRIACAGVFALLVAALGLWVGWRGAPVERLLGIHDQAYYWGSALALEREGRAGVVLEPLAHTSPEARAPWIQERQTQAQRVRDAASLPAGRAAVGPLFITDGDRPEVRGVFPPGFPLAAASLGGLGGPPTMFWANTLFLAGLAAAVGLVALRLGGRWAGLGAWMLVLAHPLHVWISRTGYAEVLLAWLAWTAWWHLLRAEADDGPSEIDAFSAASLAAILPAIKIEGVLLSAAVAFALVWRAWSRHGNPPHPRTCERVWIAWAAPVWWVCASFGACLAQNEIGRAYLHDTLRMQSLFGNKTAVLLAGILAVAGAVVVARIPGWRRHKATVGHVMLAFSALAFVFLFWIRPRLGWEDAFYYWPRGGDIRSWREDTLVRLGWFMHPAVLVAAFAGVLFAGRRAGGLAAPLLVALIVGVLFLLAWDHRNNPLLPYAMRRMVSVATPGLCLGLILPLCALRVPGRWRHVCAPAFVLALLALWLPIANRIIPRGEHTGIFAFAREIDGSLPPDATLLLPPTPVAQEFALVLSLGFGRPTLTLPNNDVALRRLEPELTRLVKSGRGLHILLDADARRDPRWESLASTSLARFEKHTHALAQTALKFPDEIQNSAYTVWMSPLRSPGNERRSR